MVKEPPGRALLAWTFIASLAAVLCYFSLGHYEHNDHMYAVAPILAQHLRVYTDFAFVQTPLSVLIFAQIDKLVGDAALFTTLRVFSLLLQLAIIGLGIGFCYRHATRRLFASVLFVSLFFSYRQADIIGAEIGNYTLALVLTALALTILDVWRGRSWTPLAVGLFAGLALSAKLSSIYVIAAFAGLYLIRERAPASPFRRMAGYGLGVLAGISPILYYLSRNPSIFLFENVHFHYLSNIYRGNAPFPALSNLAFFSVSSAIVPLALLFGGCLAAWGVGKAIGRLWPAARTLMRPLTRVEMDILFIAVAAVVGAITPGTIFQQYFAAPAFAIFLLASLYIERLTHVDRFAARFLNMAGRAALVLAMGLSVVRAYALAHETVLRQREGIYAISAVARMRHELSQIIAAIDTAHPGCHGDLVTAFGVPAMGTGAMLARIDSAGPFAMRLDAIFARKAPQYRWMSDPLRALTPRSLILSGFYVDSLTEPNSPFEPVIDGYASSHNFDPIALGNFIYRPIVLYIPRACHIPNADRFAAENP